jgi:hypothetical protein
MQGIKNALKGVQYSNPQLGERLYELCRKATSRHIDRPDEILNQQVLHRSKRLCELSAQQLAMTQQGLCCIGVSWWCVVEGWALGLGNSSNSSNSHVDEDSYI